MACAVCGRPERGRDAPLTKSRNYLPDGTYELIDKDAGWCEPTECRADLQFALTATKADGSRFYTNLDALSYAHLKHREREAAKLDALGIRKATDLEVDAIALADAIAAEAFK